MNLSPPHRSAWIAFFVAHGVLTKKIEQALAAAGMPGLEIYDVLLSLEEAPSRRMRMSELAAAVVYSRSGLTRLVDRMERCGWIRREACPTDRRSTYAVLTDAGLAVREAAWPVYREAVQEHFGSKMASEEAAALAEILGRMTDGHGLAGSGTPGAADASKTGTAAPEARPS